MPPVEPLELLELDADADDVVLVRGGAFDDSSQPLTAMIAAPTNAASPWSRIFKLIVKADKCKRFAKY